MRGSQIPASRAAGRDGEGVRAGGFPPGPQGHQKNGSSMTHDHHHDHHHHHDESHLEGNEIEKLKVLLPHWIDHNDSHIQERERWLKTAEALGLADVAQELERSIEAAREENRHLTAANDRLQQAG
jgi:nickel/cobalt exporter